MLLIEKTSTNIYLKALSLRTSTKVTSTLSYKAQKSSLLTLMYGKEKVRAASHTIDIRFVLFFHNEFLMYGAYLRHPPHFSTPSRPPIVDSNKKMCPLPSNFFPTYSTFKLSTLHFHSLNISK